MPLARIIRILSASSASFLHHPPPFLQSGPMAMASNKDGV
jgi:hypothetical protein